MGTLLEKAKEYKDLVFLVELAGWLHDLGKFGYYFYCDEKKCDFHDDFNKPDITNWEHSRIFEFPDRLTESSEVEIPPYDGEIISSKLLGMLKLPFTRDVQSVSITDKHVETKRFSKSDCWLPELRSTLQSEKSTLYDMVLHHHGGHASTYFEQLLINADHNESAEDENGAFEKQYFEDLASFDLFGFETPLKNLEQMDDERRAIYSKLEELLSSSQSPLHNRDAIWELLQKMMKKGLGKTQRAANDVRLDQHVWGVASRLKTFVMRDLISSEMKKLDDPKIEHFRILSVCWDSWELTTPFARLPDITGRFVVIHEFRERVRKLVENDCCIGNHVYQDDNGIHFIVADLDWEAEIKKEIQSINNEEFFSEISPVVYLSEGTKWITDFVKVKQRAENKLPEIGTPAWAGAWKGKSDENICPVCHKYPLLSYQTRDQICSHCQKIRENAGKYFEGIEDFQEFAKNTKMSIWNGEIADENGWTALLMFRFNLYEWLSGRMLATTMISRPQKGLFVEKKDQKASVSINDLFTNSELIQEIMSEFQIYKDQKSTLDEKIRSLDGIIIGKRQAIEGQKIKDQDRLKFEKNKLEEMLLEKAENEAQLKKLIIKYPERFFDDFVKVLEMAKPQDRIFQMEKIISEKSRLSEGDKLLLAMFMKTPTAGRLLRIWQTTQDFFSEMAEDILKKAQAEVKQKRLVFKVNLEKEFGGGIPQVELPQLGLVEVYVSSDGSRVQTISRLDEEHLQKFLSEFPSSGLDCKLVFADQKKVSVKLSLPKTEEYIPMRLITISPNLMLLQVPADRAFGIVKKAQQRYQEKMNKVQGRLPFHAGIIYMDQHYPMFAALDTARRMGETFEKFSAEALQASVTRLNVKGDVRIKAGSKRFGEWEWCFKSKLLDESEDEYHPYLLSPPKNKPGEFEMPGPYGRSILISKIEETDENQGGEKLEIKFFPNLFDFIHLDTISRRVEASAEQKDTRRRHPFLRDHHSCRPMLLETFIRMEELWDEIGNIRVSDTRLHAAEKLLAEKYINWESNSEADDPISKEYKWFIKNIVQRDFEGSKKIQDAVLEHLFFDVLELNQSILKKKISAKGSFLKNAVEEKPND